MRRNLSLFHVYISNRINNIDEKIIVFHIFINEKGRKKKSLKVRKVPSTLLKEVLVRALVSNIHFFEEALAILDA